MSEFVSTFHIDWKLMIAQTINFLLVVGIFYYFAAGPLRKLMKKRSAEIAGGIKDAKKNAELLTQTKEEYQNALNKARSEGALILAENKKLAEGEKEQMLEDTRNKVQTMIEQGKKELETEKAKMVSDAKREIASLVVSATERVVGQKPVALDESIIKELNNL